MRVRARPDSERRRHGDTEPHHRRARARSDRRGQRRAAAWTDRRYLSGPGRACPSGAGPIVRTSGPGGRTSFPGMSAYSDSGSALGGWSETLAGEAAPSGVRVVIAEPNRFRTGVDRAEMLESAEASAAHRDLPAAVRATFPAPADAGKAARCGPPSSWCRPHTAPRRRCGCRSDARRPSATRARTGAGWTRSGHWAATARSADVGGLPASRPAATATDALMTRAPGTLGDDGPLPVAAIHRRCSSASPARPTSPGRC
ncbi:SDR family NAD(P)-dependent oxidoreductase [Marinitenerispora sediminis]|uniref:SDR family NAD(P)-dependent oxidoreductase n=1 Tax=Marinitenerispora sediminis TaxID=1931232 RepID=UPI0034DD6D45